MKIVDITYQDLQTYDPGIIRSGVSETEVDIETLKLFSDGWQPFYAPVIGKVESSMTFSPVFIQTWVKYAE